MKTLFRLFLCVGLLSPTAPALAQDSKQTDSPWADFIQPDFPFFGHTLDARKFSKTANLTPRGLIFQIGEGTWACFDPDLLRMSLIWDQADEESPITLGSMAPGSYHNAGRKAGGGQGELPKPLGKEIAATGLHSGFYVGELPEKLTDPRPAAADPEEVGRGPVDPELMRFEGLHLMNPQAVVFEYEVAGAKVFDSLASPAKGFVFRELAIAPCDENLFIAIGVLENGQASGISGGDLVEKEGTSFVRVAASLKPSQVTIMIGPNNGGFTGSMGVLAQVCADPSERERLIDAPDWNVELNTKGQLAPDDAPYVRDEIGFPTDNQWKRNVRLAGIDFFEDGSAALCTFDGDVWLVDGLDADLKNVTWRRYASGLNEPMSLQIVDGEIYVFGRTCIWRLHDENDDGIADFYENFSNVVGQTAETREFANSMIKIPGGGFYLAKPGQLATSRGHFNGTISRVSADGRSAEIVASGFRQPFIGLDAKTGVLTASDQQGHWVPTTPIHVIKPGGHYGFLPPMVSEHPKPISKPLVWIPHFVNQSGASQFTNHDKRWGPLAGQLLHVGFNRPELFRVYRDGDQGAVARFMTGFGTGPLKSAVNPKDGQVYIAGFKIWGTVAEEICGFYRIRYTGEGSMETPIDVRTSKEGIFLKFDFEVDPTIVAWLENYKIDIWNYKRESSYGSGHYKTDGTPGQETLRVSSAYISEDKRSVFLGVPGMKPCESMRLTYRLPQATEVPQVRSIFLTIHELKSLDLGKLGFGDIEVDLKLPAAAAGGAMVASVEQGKLLYTTFGCMTCHSIDGSKTEKPGPTWLDLYGARRDFEDGTSVKNADEVYLRESILDPQRQTTKGFNLDEGKMPSYLGVLQDSQIDSLILYIKTLAKK
ncbi:MAG: cytochrome c2 [Verrucomicrobiales bacterium]|jgi:cytochrome c2